MRKYRLLISGNCALLRLEGQVRECGFYTTKFVEAANRESAENEARNLVQRELSGIVLNEYRNPPSISIEEVVELHSFKDHPVPGTGFTWYLDDEKPGAPTDVTPTE